MTEEYVESNALSKAERQKKYRKNMKARGFVCRQLWIPEDKVDEIEATIAVMRSEHQEEDLI